MRHTHFGHPAKSVVAEHSIKVGHRSDFNISILRQSNRIHRSHPNRDGGSILIQAWYPVTNMMEQSSEAPKRKDRHSKLLTPP